MNFDGIGLHPDNAVKIVLSMYDGKSTEDKIRLLLNSRAITNLKSIDLPASFSSGVTIHLNAGELIGLGSVAAYYNWRGKGSGNTYQAFVGVEDSAKAQVENVLSDGAIWHNQTKSKMLVQQVMVQGYFPRLRVNNEHVVTQIKKKVERRADYPDNCALIVNVFSQEGDIKIEEIRTMAKEEIGSFTDVYLVIYRLPLLDRAKVIHLSEVNSPDLIISLLRHKYENGWYFNYEGKRGHKST